jgi:hypothetical protein
MLQRFVHAGGRHGEINKRVADCLESMSLFGPVPPVDGETKRDCHADVDIELNVKHRLVWQHDKYDWLHQKLLWL